MSSPTHCKWQVWGPHQRPGDCLQSPSTNSWDVEEAMLSAWSPLGERLKGEGEKESWQEKEVSHTVRPPCPGLECSVAPRKWRSVPPVRNQAGAAARDAHRGLASATSLHPHAALEQDSSSSSCFPQEGPEAQRGGGLTKAPGRQQSGCGHKSSSSGSASSHPHVQPHL